jgi:hypothetical protein
MVDPSLLLSQEGFTWLAEDPAARTGVVISSESARWVRGEVDIRPTDLLAREDLQGFVQRRASVSDLLGDLDTFSYGQVESQLSAPHNSVLRSLVDSADLSLSIAERHLYADEWAFLQSQSVLLSKLRRPLDAFRDAGSFIIELGRRTGRNLIYQVIPKENVPTVLTPGFIAKATAKWIVVAGASAGSGTLAGIAASAIGGPIAGLAAGGGTKYVVGKVGGAAVLAIDP